MPINYDCQESEDMGAPVTPGEALQAEMTLGLGGGDDTLLIDHKIAMGNGSLCGVMSHGDLEPDEFKIAKLRALSKALALVVVGLQWNRPLHIAIEIASKTTSVSRGEMLVFINSVESLWDDSVRR